jgi:transcriptional regulator with XRE-family HTH domain
VLAPLVEVFAANLRALRVGAGLTQRELGDALGVTDEYVRKLERGARGATLELVDAAAAALGVEPSYLVQVNDVPRRPMAAGRRARLRRRVPR